MGQHRGEGTARDVALLRPEGRRGAARPSGPVEPPLELLSVAGALADARLTPSPRVSILDAHADAGGNDAALGRALELAPGAIVLGTPGPGTPTGGAASALGELVALGGKLGSELGGRCTRIALIDDEPALAEALLGERAADLVVRGEPDETLPRAVADLLSSGERRSDWSGARGVSWRRSDGTVAHERGASRPLRPATPAWDLLDLEPYSFPRRPRALDLLAPRWLRGEARTASAAIRTTRSCVAGCRTCHGSFGSSGPERPVRDVVAEIRELVTRRGVRELRIVDHAFDGQPARAAEIARAIAQIRRSPALRGVRVHFPNGFRGDGLTEELVEALVALGLARFDVRLVTASERLQRLLKRNIRLDRALAGLAAVERAGAVARLYLDLGLPTETTGEAAHTIRWAARSPARELELGNGASVSFGPYFLRASTGEIDDFVALRRRALRTFYGDPRRGASRLLRASLAGARLRWG